jgi:hypothetical protein
MWKASRVAGDKMTYRVENFPTAFTTFPEGEVTPLVPQLTSITIMTSVVTRIEVTLPALQGTLKPVV